MKIAWFSFAVLATLLGGNGLMAYLGAQSAPQQTAAAAYTLACVGVPYLILRAIQEALAEPESLPGKESDKSVQHGEETDSERLRRIISRD